MNEPSDWHVRTLLRPGTGAHHLQKAREPLRRRQVVFLSRLVVHRATFGPHTAAASEPDHQIKNQNYRSEDDERRYEPQMEHGVAPA
jgi:hypothetical protein